MEALSDERSTRTVHEWASRGRCSFQSNRRKSFRSVMSDLLLDIPHRQQQSDWDCGMTCLEMIIDFYQLHSASTENILRSYQCNQSTWTIDLLHLLHQVGIPSTLHTRTIGCSAEYNNVPYYQSLIDQDRQRVDRLFQKYSTDVKLGSVSWDVLKEHLIQHRRPCLVLVDANQLPCSSCHRSFLTRLVERVQPLFSSYQGHYVILVGFETKEGDEWIHYVDPGKSERICRTNRETFDRARKAFGTDEDLIFCFEQIEKE